MTNSSPTILAFGCSFRATFDDTFSCEGCFDSCPDLAFPPCTWLVSGFFLLPKDLHDNHVISICPAATQVFFRVQVVGCIFGEFWWHSTIAGWSYKGYSSTSSKCSKDSQVCELSGCVAIMGGGCAVSHWVTDKPKPKGNQTPLQLLVARIPGNSGFDSESAIKLMIWQADW